MKLVSFLLACVICSSFIGCSRRPAYSNINVNGSRPSQADQSSSEQPADGGASGADPTGGSTAAAPGEVPAAGPAQPPQQNPSQQEAFKMPAFLDTQKGGVKDLPSYPAGQRLNVQYGPTPTGEMASIVIVTSDSIDSISAFYDKVIKSNKWQVTVRNQDSEYAEWRMRKGETEEGGVTIRKDPDGRGRLIQIVRSSKFDEKK